VTPQNAPQQPPPPPQQQPPRPKGPEDFPKGVIVDKAERVEYRDAKGNRLNKEQVEALKGKVNFEVSNVPSLALCWF